MNALFLVILFSVGLPLLAYAVAALVVCTATPSVVAAAEFPLLEDAGGSPWSFPAVCGGGGGAGVIATYNGGGGGGESPTFTAP